MLTLSSFSTELARVLATVDEADFEWAVEIARERRSVYFIGNGGSAAIASHMAIDWMNKGGFSTRALNDPAALTCLANDYGYEDVFRRQLRDISGKDLLVAISSSGKSPSILTAAKYAWEERGSGLLTLSGFNVTNPLNSYKGGVGMHIPSDNYAIVENAHMAILHAMLEALKA
jgi:D-sedoheptulose 7-phosphate isomerase